MHHELEKFLSVVEHGSFSAAAKVGHVSQPALTAAVQSLEARYDNKLIVRNTRPLQLTKAGQEVYATAKRLRLELMNLSSRLQDIQSGHNPKVSLGAIDSVAMQLFRTGFDIEEYEVHIDNSARLVEEVRSGRLELALITEPTTALPDELVTKPMYEEPFLLVCHPEDASSIQTTLARHKFLDNFITYNAQSHTFQRILAAADSAAVELRISFASTSPELMRQLVQKRRGVALLPESLVQEDVAHSRLSTVTGWSFTRPVTLIHQRGKTLHARHQALIERTLLSNRGASETPAV